MNVDPGKLAAGAASAYASDAVLRDGGSIHLRAIRPDDKRLLDRFVEEMSPESKYFRFFRSKRRLTQAELERFTELDFVREAALVATLRHGAEEEIVGVGRYAAGAGVGAGEARPHRAEFAFAVADRHQGRGIGTLLLERLVPIARANGIQEFEADVLGENNRMLEMLSRSGFVVRRAFEGGVFHVSFPTKETEELLAASHKRERHAAAMSLVPILEPRSVAVVGASRTPGSIGTALVANLKRDGFRGPIYPVNPRAAEIQGLKCYPSVSAIGAPVDLAVIAVPAPAVEEVVADCARAGARGAVVISAGFAETAGPGRDVQRRLVELVRSSGMRMVGPNCMGVLNMAPEVRLNATFAPSSPPAGSIAMLSQSGALGIAILDYLKGVDVGVSSFVSVGNKADVSGNDLLAYWAQDAHTKVIVLYLESFGNPRKFARVAPEVAREKPIVAVKSGRSAAGTRAASSHSASLASLDVAVDALFEEAGVIRTDTLEELFDVAALLAMQPVPAGRRVGVVTNAGGPGILLADACEARGLVLPELGESTLSELRGFLPPQAGLANPVDMIASATPEQYGRAIEAVGRDPAVDSVVVVHIPVLQTGLEEVAAAIGRGASKVPAAKPALAVLLSQRGAVPVLNAAGRGRIPVFRFPENAAMALAAAERYGRWRRQPVGSTLELEAFRVAAIRAVVDRVLESAPGPVWLEPEDLATVLRATGIDFASGEVSSLEGAAAAGERLGYPLVAKAIAPGLVHKSDVGGVILGLRSARDVEAAVRTLDERMRAAATRLDGVFLQREVKGGIEALVGVTTDPTFGPLVVCGLGGVLVELLKDVTFRLPPVSDSDAAEMLSRLRSARLLDGYRGAPPGDREALGALLQRVSALVEAVPEIVEMDLNPVKVLPPGKGAIVVDARMRLARG
ncbi:MAG: GNAT family N-acetyltransferase [Planctomycetes bacterium]|nr:GNAT family N-acetyltransferase [Planctomycetota bacterium]